MSTASGLPRSRAWLRVLVLLLALLVPATHTQAHAAPVASGEVAECGVLETALRPAARAADRPAVPARPAPLPDPAPGVPQGRPLPESPRPPYALHTVRTVVLRC
ncbi:hypothetical protein [Streptomyces sp. HUAS ZL42]|uniref:hypothetical protein n=1 Tax=Streptomyces sp. HUAS ZL42 TaxID=3231715 RepID=UPI00345E21D3